MINKIELISPLKCTLKEKAVDIAKTLRESAQRHIYVVDEDDMPIGIISTTDMNNKIVAEGKDPKSITAEDIMSAPIEVYDKEEDAIKVYKEMTANKRWTCAIVEKKKFIGILSLNRLIIHITEQGRWKWD